MDKEYNDKVILVNNRVDELTRVAGFLEELGEEWNLPIPIVFNLNLVVEEALSNIILYGFNDNNEHTIEILFNRDNSLITITITDDGIEYDPTQSRDPDISLSSSERPVGGLGIFLIKRIMDSVHYKRIDNLNILTLTKII